MKKLTEKQANLLSGIISEGGWMSRKHIATYYGVSVAGALVKKGLLELTDTRNYKVMIDAARAALDAYDAEAFAPTWTPATASAFAARADEPAPDPRAAQIAALTRDLEAARADAAALRAQVLGLINHGKAARFMLTQAVSIGLDLASAPNQRELLDYIYSAVDEMPPEDFELPAVYAAPDNGQRVSAEAEMIAALRQRDNGNRTPADNVLAMFADDDEGTIA